MQDFLGGRLPAPEFDYEQYQREAIEKFESVALS
jgi:hypothetical protein